MGPRRDLAYTMSSNLILHADIRICTHDTSRDRTPVPLDTLRKEPTIDFRNGWGDKEIAAKELRIPRWNAIVYYLLSTLRIRE